jgi:hypothetical protein
MSIKVTMFFSAFNYSWSESHYLLGVTAFAPAISAASFLANYRQNLLGFNAYLVNVRLSYYPASRQVFDLNRNLFPTSGTLQVGSDTFGADTTDAPFTCLLLNLSNLVANRNLYLAGIPDVDVEFTPGSPNGYLAQGNFTTPLNVYMNYLCGGASNAQWGFRTRVPQAAQAVLGLLPQPGYQNNMGVVTAANPGVLQGAYAFTIGFKTLNPRALNLSGGYTVQAVIPPSSGNPNWTTVLNRTVGVNPLNFISFGFIEPLVFGITQYAFWRAVKITHRKRGGSYGLPRGRSRVRR